MLKPSLNISNLQNGIVFLFFCVPFVNYVGNYIANTTAQLLLYGIIYTLFLLFIPRAKHISRSIIFMECVIIYLGLLTIRLFIDYIYPNKTNFLFGSSDALLFIYIVQIILPSFLLTYYKFSIDERKVGLLMAILLFVCVLLSLHKITNGDVKVSNDGRYDNGYGIFCIEFGHYAVSLILICIILFLQDKSIIMRSAFIIGIVIGFLGTAFAGSRGPFLALAICIAFYFIARSKSPTKFLSIVLLFILILPLLSYLLNIFADTFKESGFRSFQRIYDSFFGDESIVNKTSGRDSLWKEGFELFLQSPLIGHSLFIPGKIYAHNIFIEAFMAVGIFGGLSFISINILGIISSWNIIRNHNEYAIVPLLYIQYLIFGSFSSTIIGLPLYWLFLLLTMNYNWQQRSRIENKN